MRYFRKIIFLVYLFTGSILVNAQALSIITKIDTAAILIGDQVLFQYELTKNKDIQVQLPQVAGQLNDTIIVLQDLGIDSVVQNEQDIITASYLITAFDSGLFEIPKLPIVFTNGEITDTLYTASKQLFVTTLPVDMNKGIVDIKKPFDAPLAFKEMLPWIALILGVAIIIGLIVYILRRKKQNKPVINLAKPKDPPHVIALQELENLRNERLWQQNKIKDYYVRLTDIMREYLEERFAFPALEQTTDEILKVIETRAIIQDEKLYQSVKEVLGTADLVKFAKASPLPAENDGSMHVAEELVKRTMFEAQANEDEELVNNEVENKKLLTE